MKLLFEQSRGLVVFAGKKNNASRTVIAAVVPCVVFVVLIVSICAYLRLRKAKEIVECKLRFL